MAYWIKQMNFENFNFEILAKSSICKGIVLHNDVSKPIASQIEDVNPSHTCPFIWSHVDLDNGHGILRGHSGYIKVSRLQSKLGFGNYNSLQNIYYLFFSKKIGDLVIPKEPSRYREELEGFRNWRLAPPKNDKNKIKK